jgi:hypothetical protein
VGEWRSAEKYAKFPLIVTASNTKYARKSKSLAQLYRDVRWKWLDAYVDWTVERANNGIWGEWGEVQDLGMSIIHVFKKKKN